MKALFTCPTGEVLQQWVSGFIPEESAETLSEHITECPQCLGILRDLPPRDALLAALRDPLPFNSESEDLRQLMESCCQWKPGNPPVPRAIPASQETPAEPLAQAGESVQEATRELLSLLAAPDESEALGQLGTFVVRRVLGVGGMGIVVAAEDPSLGREVAAKILRPSLAASAAARQRFLREARAMAAVIHDNLVPIYQVGEANGISFFTMPVLRGETLQSLLARHGPLPVAAVIRVCLQVASGLAAAHACNLIHRDIKPGNIWLEAPPDIERKSVDSSWSQVKDAESFSRVKLLDFGLARVSAESLDLTTTGQIAGTPAYMSPEQARGFDLDCRSDLFSLGCVMFECATGKRPFSGHSQAALLLAVTTEPTQRVLELNDSLPPRLALLIEQLLEKSPDRRIQSAAEVVESLAALERGATLDVGPDRKIPNAARVPRNELGRLRRTSVRAVLAAVALFVVLIPAGLILLGDKDAAPPKKSPAVPVADHLPATPSPEPATVPFDQARALAAQEAWAEHWSVKVEVENSIRMRLRLIPPGEFRRGLTAAELESRLAECTTDQEKLLVRSEIPSQMVTLSQAFYCGVTEVTCAQFRAFVNATGHLTEAEVNGRGSVVPTGDTYQYSQAHTWKTNPGTPSDDHPVTCVSWNDAVAFCEWLGRQENRRYSLPSEAQWEFACRAGCQGTWSLGDGDGSDVKRLEQFSWFANSSGPQPVGKKRANAFGLLDMHGNVWEWCADSFSPDYYTLGPVRDPPGPVPDVRNPLRVLRGGSFNFPAPRARSSHRNGDVAMAPAFNRGFRVVMTLEPKPTPP